MPSWRPAGRVAEVGSSQQRGDHFTAINADLAARGLLLREGTLVDATLIAAPLLHHESGKEMLKAVKKARASARAYVEHSFHILNNLFRHRKVRYRGLAKNGHQLHTLFSLANAVIGARQTTA